MLQQETGAATEIVAVLVYPVCALQCVKRACQAGKAGLGSASTRGCTTQNR